MTVSTVEPLTTPSVALMLEVPVATPCARPVAVLIVATEVVAEAQVTEPVRSAVRAVGVGAGGGELLGQPGRDRGVGRA